MLKLWAFQEIWQSPNRGSLFFIRAYRHCFVCVVDTRYELQLSAQAWSSPRNLSGPTILAVRLHPRAARLRHYVRKGAGHGNDGCGSGAVVRLADTVEEGYFTSTC